MAASISVAFDVGYLITMPQTGKVDFSGCDMKCRHVEVKFLTKIESGAEHSSVWEVVFHYRIRGGRDDCH